MTKLPLYGLKELSRAQKNVVKDFLWMCTEDGLEYYHTGSRLVKDIEWDDVDFVVKVPNLDNYTERLVNNGWENGDQYEELEKQFISFKKQNINLIVTQDKEYYDKWCESSNIVSHYQIKEKYNRIAAFGYVFKRQGYTIKDFEDAIQNKEPEYSLLAF